ncbi:ABC transporter substrate-binding protein [Niveispirillum fermenti]|uniref:ABC transporter substrate-binding protein n=1 Tax=Niveispirillum fermenti TaxID=1233113 RepID=UPI003A895650
MRGRAGRPAGFLPWLVLLLMLAVPAPMVRAEAPDGPELRIGLDSLGVTYAPYAVNSLSTRTLLSHLYEGLVARRPDLGLVPSLATGWSRRPDGAWLFELRPGVLFHRGGVLRAGDVVYSLCRILATPGSVLATTVRQFAMVEAVGADKVAIHPLAPFADVPGQMVGLWIVQAPSGWAGRFDPAGCAGVEGTPGPVPDGPPDANGTGPYRLVQYQADTHLVMVRFPGHWHGVPAWGRVVMLRIGDAGRRARALVVGEVDLIDMVPAESLAYLQGRPNLEIVAGPIYRVFMIQMNQRSAAMDVQGRNPLADARVRRAISLAIDRGTLARRTMVNGAKPTSQLVPTGMAGHQPDLSDDPYDPDAARRLMREAGFTDGFTLSLATLDHAARLGTAVARYLQQIGIRVILHTLSEAELISRAAAGDFQLFIGSANLFSGDFTTLVRDLLASPDEAAGRGGYNRGQFRDAEMDALVARLMTLPPDDPLLPAYRRRVALLAHAQTAVVPLAHAGRLWAVRHGLAFSGRMDGMTLAMDVAPPPP